jgi:flagellar hook protein FlgE
MQAGVSGLLSSGEAISVIGNNLANVSTTGFKEGRTLFSNLLSSTINNGQIGDGSQVQGVQNMFSQGTLETTGSATDLAIQGNAMFVLKGPNSTEQYYSRAGSFAFNSDNILTDPSGNEVLGYGMTDMIKGTSNGVLGTIDLANFSTMAPKATTTLSVTANLDSSSSPPATTWDPSQAGFNPTTESNFSTSATVYDAQGNAKSLTLYFANTGANTWDLYTYDGTTYTAKGAGTPLTFDASTGALKSPSPATISTNGLTVDLTGTTQFATASAVSSQTQDGYAAGNETSVSIDSQGVVNVEYSNSQTQKVAQVALATFASPTGLNSVGNNLYSATTASGAAVINNTSNLSNNTIASNSLEQSNVDLGGQLTQLITIQQAYEANSKTITTADEMMQDVLSVIK